ACYVRLGSTSHIRLSRCITLLMGVAMLVLACLVNDVIAALSIAYNLLVGGLLVPIVGALLWRRASPQGAIASIVAGCLAVIACMARDGLLANSPIVYGLLASLATFVAVSLATRPAASLRAQPE
ncbi:sodium:solute symporter, partial [Pseudomonas aeruginosa]